MARGLYYEQGMKEQPLRIEPTDGPSLLNLRRLLVPVDFSPRAAMGFKYALQLAQPQKLDLILLHVLEPGLARNGVAPQHGKLDSAEKNLRALQASARRGGLASAGTTVRTGLPAHEIVMAANDLDIDLIVMSTHGYTGWKHFCIGSTAEQVVRAAPCPVLVVREREKGFR